MANKNAKWFFTAQRAAEKDLDRMYPQREVSYQVIEENRVITGYLGDRGDGSYRKLELHIVRNGAVGGTLYELVPIALVPKEDIKVVDSPTPQETGDYYNK